MASVALSNRYLTFRVGSHRYALPATAITEVLRIEFLARVPQAPPALLGVTNLRGSVVPVVGLRELLKLGSSPDNIEKLILVLARGVQAALAIDAVDSLEEVSDDQLERADEAWLGVEGETINHAFKSGQSRELTKVLDIDSLMSGAFAERASEKRRDRVTKTSPRRAVAEGAAHSEETLLTFQLGAQEFAFSITAVEELLPLPACVSAISRCDSIIVGFTSIRDALIPLLSLRGLLGFDAATKPTGREKVLILKVAGAPVGLIVDDSRAVVSADTTLMEPIPAALVARTGGESRIRAVYRGEGGRRLISILSPDLLFCEEVMQRLSKVDPHVQIHKKSESVLVADEAIFLVFRLGEDEFGLPIDSVVEVAPVPSRITRVPKAPKFLEGVINLRGDVLPVVDQRRRFEMPAIQIESRRLVVLKTTQLKAGIIVDSVTEVLRSSADVVLPPPDLSAQMSRLVYGVVNLQTARRLILLLDPKELLTRAEQGQLDTFQTQSKKAGA